MKRLLFYVGTLFIIFDNSYCMQHQEPNKKVLTREYKEALFNRIKDELPVEVLTSETEEGESGEKLLESVVCNEDGDRYRKLNDLIIRYEGEEYSFSTVAETIRFKLSRCLLEGFKYGDPNLSVYKFAYNFCRAWKMKDLLCFPSPY